MSTIREYAARITSYEPLTAEQERALFLAMGKGSKDARDKLIAHNLRLALSYVRKYILTNPEMAEDLIQQANMGIVRAVDRFDVTLGFKFSTFAMEQMQYLIVRYIKDRKNLVRVPVHKFNVEVSMVDANLMNLDAPVDSDAAETFGEIVASPDNAFADFDANAFWQQVRSHLTQRETDILTMRFRFDMLQAEVGERIGVSKQRVAQIEQVALGKLREAQVAA